VTDPHTRTYVRTGHDAQILGGGVRNGSSVAVVCYCMRGRMTGLFERAWLLGLVAGPRVPGPAPHGGKGYDEINFFFSIIL